MYELKHVKGNSYYIDNPAKIGLVKLDDENVILIDSGNDKNAGRKVRQVLDKNNWNLKAIYNTHSHADHIGGNSYLERNRHCEVYSPGLEQVFTTNPILEPTFLFGGNPPKDLKHKFLLAEASPAKELTQESLPEGFELIPLEGHTVNMVGIKSPDNVFYIADSVASPKTIDKYKIVVLHDVEKYLNTLENLKQIEADYYVPAHAEVSTDINEIVDYNIDSTYEIIDQILEFLKEPLSFDELIKKIFDDYNQELNLEQYVLTGSTIKAYLSYLRDKDRIEPVVIDNTMKWRAI